jgi:hypothetical protein
MTVTAETSVKNVLRVYGLGNDDVKVHGFTSTIVPTEIAGGISTVGTTAGSLDFGDIAAGKAVLLWFRALTGNFYIKLGVTTGTPILTDAHLYVLEGESYPIPINPNATAMPGIRYVGDSASAAFEYRLLGKA